MRRLPLLLLLALIACDEPATAPTPAPPASLRDPQSCSTCHPDHLRQWSGSMHAYSTRSPVFRAMFQRGQRETNGAIGPLCLGCHAPLAVEAGLVGDSVDLDAIEPTSLGITCFYCHTITSIEADHNAQFGRTEDGALRGGLTDPLPTDAHGSVYSPLHDRTHPDSSKICGGCHDVVLPGGLRLERSFVEWQETLYANPVHEELLTCGGCHMEGRDGLAADVAGAPLRRVHDHSMPGVDVAFHDFPEREAQRALVQAALDTTVVAQLCVGGTEAELTLENVAAGHSFPSGAALHRRLWVELRAFRGDVEIFSSGVVEAGEGPDEALDPSVWLFRDKVFGADGREVHMTWEVASLESNLLPGPTARDPLSPEWRETHVARSYSFPERPDRVELRLRLTPFGYEELDSLVASGDLSPADRALMPVWTLASTVVTWREADLQFCVP